MWRAIFDFLESIGEGGIVFLVVGIMFLVVIVPMLFQISGMAW